MCTTVLDPDYNAYLCDTEVSEQSSKKVLKSSPKRHNYAKIQFSIDLHIQAYHLNRWLLSL